MKIFSDFHHTGLYHSFQLLFEKRLGYELFRPVGMDWYKNGYWRMAELYNNHPATISQFLEIRSAQAFPYIPPFSNEPLNKISEVKPDYYLIDIKPLPHRAITLEQFKVMNIDVIIASIPAHFNSFARLITDHKPGAKMICHFGNIMWYLKDYKVKNVMASIAPQPVPSGVNAVFYHQEFSTDIYHCFAPRPVKSIKSFVHVFDGYPDADLLYQVEKLMPDWKFSIHGASNRDGVITGDENVAEAINSSRFIWHLKAGGDGFGHIIHQAFACGRPPIVKLSQYKDKLAGQLMIDGVTCINVDGLTPAQIVEKVLKYNDDELYQKMSEAAHKKFKEIVDFDKEEGAIRGFLDKLY